MPLDNGMKLSHVFGAAPEGAEDDTLGQLDGQAVNAVLLSPVGGADRIPVEVLHDAIERSYRCRRWVHRPANGD